MPAPAPGKQRRYNSPSLRTPAASSSLPLAVACRAHFAPESLACPSEIPPPASARASPRRSLKRCEPLAGLAGGVPSPHLFRQGGRRGSEFALTSPAQGSTAANPASRSRSRQVKFTRREFAIGIGSGAFALTLAAVVSGLSNAWFMQPAAAQDPSPADLLKAGPLGDMVLGDEKAPVTIIEYASMTCPHCAHFHETAYPELKKRYIDTGKVRFIFREFPLDALAAAGFMLARCSAQTVGSAPSNPEVAKSAAQRYYAMIETLFAQQRDWVVQRPLQPLL